MPDEKLFTIPLRKEFIKAPKYKKTSKAVRALKQFIQKHMKVKEVKIGKHLNQYLWQNGNRNPPPKVKVKTIKEEDYARVELPEFEFEKKKEKKEEKKGAVEKAKEKLGIKAGEKKPEKLKETPEIQKEKAAAELKEQKKEHIGHKPEPGTPSKELKETKKEKELMREERIVTMGEKKERHDAKPV